MSEAGAATRAETTASQQRIDESQPINEIRRGLIATLDHWKDLGLGGGGIGRRACVVSCLPLIHFASTAHQILKSLVLSSSGR